MKPERTYWVITVVDPADLERGIEKYEKRFQFDDLEEAYACATAAQAAKFTVTTSKVETVRGKKVEVKVGERG